MSGVIGPVDLPGRIRPVQGRIPALLNLAPFGRHRVHLVPMPNLARAEILGNGPYPVTDVLTVQIKRRSVSFDPAHGDMDVRVFGIEMRYSKPLQSRVQIFLHFAHEIASQSVQVDPFAEFGEMIIFQSLGSPAFCQRSRTSGGAKTSPWLPMAAASWPCITLSRVM